ncbi:unnamed protein product [Rodentolepis nana]|uniref:VHS domain-containing protein n=1 Tax=Rodentolepis nana TaxID=102285 RepID=A0A0R3TYQ0_RODNA|nr:unnamed protein product [Rodentolepis nana]
MASVNGTQSLEDMITEITSPLTTHMDLNAFKKIYDRINIDPHGPELALRLLAHKIQSPVEKEALSTLVILDLCVQNCGPNFHRELGKYKFLNEMMKVLLPKHLGLNTPQSVRERCIMLMFVWQRDFGDKYPKLKEAYQALKAQNIITEDPVIQDDSERNRDRMANRTDIFGNSRYKDKLARLLKSKNPEDFREANAIIKSIVNEEIVANIKRTRPTIFELALTDDDRVEGFLTDVIETCSRASSVLERYEVEVLHKPPSTVEDPAIFLVDKHENRLPPSQPTSNTSADDLLTMSPSTNHELLQQDLLNLGIGDSLSPRNQSPSLSAAPKSSAQSNVNLLDRLLSNSPKNQTQPPQSSQNIALRSTLNSNAPPPPPGNIASSRSSISAPPSKKSATNIFSELDMVGRVVFGMPTPESGSLGAPKANSSSGSLNSMASKTPEPAKQLPSEVVERQQQQQQEASIELPSLSSLPAINTSAIQPHPTHNQPIRVFPVEGGSSVDGEEGGASVDVMLHCTANKPHPSVVVFVAVVTNRSALPLTNLLLRFGVEKPLKVRQLELSSSHLPEFCPFLPPSPAQQTIYVQRPPTLEVSYLQHRLPFIIAEGGGGFYCSFVT